MAGLSARTATAKAGGQKEQTLPARIPEQTFYGKDSFASWGW